MKKKPNSFNDRMVSKTVLPTIYLWLLASGAVVAMGIWKPDVVLTNLDGFIALIAIISGVAAPALATILRMWESEQQIEIDNIAVGLENERTLETVRKEHVIEMEKQQLTRAHEMSKSAQEHQQIVEKHKESLAKLTPIRKKMGEE